MCMKGLTFLLWSFIMIYPLVLKIYRENLKISTITGRLPVFIGITKQQEAQKGHI